MVDLSLRLLGVPILEAGGRLIEVDTRKASALLVYLALNPEPQPREVLSTLLWPDYDESGARAALRRTLSTLRKALGEGVLQTSWTSVGLADRSACQVDVDLFRAALMTTASHCPPPKTACAGCLARLEQAVALYRGDFMTGFGLRDSPNFDDWQTLQAEELRRLLSNALERLSCDLAANHDYAQALNYTLRWLSLDPLNEAAHRQAMLCYAWSGQRAAALRQYRDCVRLLEQQLSVPPLEETTRLYQQISEHTTPPPMPAGRDRNAVPPALSAASPGRLADQHIDERQAAGAPTGDGPPAPQKPNTGQAAHRRQGTHWRLPLVGRETEFARMEEAYREAATHGFVIALQGEAGIGKTRLAEDFIAHMRGPAGDPSQAASHHSLKNSIAGGSTNSAGPIVLTARCYAGETNLAYAPFINLLSEALSDPGLRARLAQTPLPWRLEAARLLPEIAPGGLSLPGQEPPANPGTAAVASGRAARQGRPTQAGPAAPGEAGRVSAQSRFYEGLRQVLLRLAHGAAPGILFFDDLHWADAASLDLLTYLARRLSGQPLLLVLTWRAAGLPADHRLHQILAELQRAGRLFSLSLARLSETEIAELVRAVHAPMPADLPVRLYQESEGLPFFAVEYLQAVSSAPADWSMPGNVRDLIHTRLAHLGETERQLLSTAAVIGRSFDLTTLLEASGRREHEAVPALENLIAQNLVSEQHPHESSAEIHFDFTHDKIRSLVYEETSLTRLRLLHRRVAETLVAQARQRREPGLHWAQIGQHYRLAGQDEQAAEAYQQAGEYARSLHAHIEARQHFQMALALGRPLAGRLHEAIGDLQTTLGDYPAALTSYETAAALAESDTENPEANQNTGGKPPTVVNIARIEHKLGRVHHRRGEWDLAMSHFEAALSPAGSPDNPSFSAQVYSDWSLAAHQAGHAGQAQRLAGLALEDANQSGQPTALAQAYNLLGILARAGRDLEQARVHLEKSLHFAGLSGDPGARIAALNNLSLLLSESDQVTAAIELAQAALEQCTAIGDRHREAALLNNLADLHHAAGESERALQYLTRAVVIYTEIGGEAGDLQPEIWKLIEW